jgi:2-amino-4-hydroxy-6-hydroxymethyldihydropteridine diphosphokinase
MERAWIGLGSNLQDPPAQLRAALRRIEVQPGLHLVAQSRFYRSAPLGPSGQADYCDAVCGVDTDLPPLELLGCLQRIENQAGRDRSGPRWSARVLDLDLLLYGTCVLDTPRLKLPHPELHRRNFVLVPLAELAPGLGVPGLGNVADLAAQLGHEDLSLWA